MMKILRDDYTGDVHISTGLTTKAEVRRIGQFWEEGKGDAKIRLILYKCTSGHPVQAKDVYWKCTTYEKHASRVKALGFSGHHNRIRLDIAAYPLGATWNERHFTGDRTCKGTDHAAFLEPPGMSKLCRVLHKAWTAMSLKEQEILPVEAVQRQKPKWGFNNAA